MNLDELRAAYDREQRIDVEYPDAHREVTPRTVRFVQTIGRQQGWVLWSDLDESTVEETISAEIAYFEAIGIPFEWKVYSHDQPSDLKARLIARGFVPREPADAIMILDLEAAPDLLAKPIPEAIQPVSTPEGIRVVMDLLHTVWDEDFAPFGEELISLLLHSPETLSMYAATLDERVVSAAWIMYTGQSRFAGLWGGSTLPDYRRRGFYTGLLAIRAREALARGIRFLTVDASPMSRPILEKHGFVCICTATECNWSLGTQQEV
jgi:GNAT superfamily N-acetyltransferase